MALAYAMNNGNLAKFLDEIRTAPVPSKVDAKWLASRGYTGQNDKYLIALLKNLGFIDQAGKPEKRWHDHRHTGEEGRVRAAGVVDAYSGFFELHADGQKRSEEEFKNWARIEDPSASPTTIQRSWKTFGTLVGMADFDGAVGASAPPTPGGGGHADKAEKHTPTPPPAPAGLTVGGIGGITLNIELQLPASADAQFFDDFFSSLRRNLIDEND